MLKIQLVSLFIFCSIILSAQNINNEFKTDIKTEKKPWTNLQFNNDAINFQFAIMADRTGRNRPGIFKMAINKINLMQPEFVICVGDLIEGKTTDSEQLKTEWAEMDNMISVLKMPFFYVPGNHDISNKVMKKEWDKRYGTSYYNFIYKNTLFITIDSNADKDFKITRNQTDFVINTLKENTGVRWTFIFMHHPLWENNTDGRFEEIEEALKERNYSVFAGHQHHYSQTERHGSNYYILSTTGGGNSQLGSDFGQFDHISWVTLTNKEPIMANLKIDAILPHDIVNKKTRKLENSMLENSNFNPLVLCNKGKKFKHGTLYLPFKNPSEADLEINLSFFHNNQLQIKNTKIKTIVAAGENRIIDIPFTSSKPINWNTIDSLSFEWKMNYLDLDKPKFERKGIYQIPIEPTKTEFIDNHDNSFVEKNTIGFNNQFPGLNALYKQNNSAEKKYTKPIVITETTKFLFQLQNGKKEFSSQESCISKKSAR